MSVGILLITHPGVGSALLHTVMRILGSCPLSTKCLEIPAGAEIDPLLAQAAEHLAALDSGDGVLVFSDMYGATPSNIACRLAETGRAAVVSGVSLPMLVRVYNYPQDDLDRLCHKAAEGGERGITFYTRQQALADREQSA
jgi:PTS system ascorbate-specific IIA component